MAGLRSALNYNKFLLLLLSGIRPNIYSYTSRSDFMILYISPPWNYLQATPLEHFKHCYRIVNGKSGIGAEFTGTNVILEPKAVAK